MSHPEHAEHHESVKQEEDVLPPRLLVYALFGAIAFSLALVGVSIGIQRSREAELRPSGAFPEKDLGPIQERSNVHEELYSNLGRGQIVLLTQRQLLERFDWVGDDRRTVRVPIDVAMDLVVNGSSK